MRIYKAALVAYKKVIEINPEHTRAQNGLDKIYDLAKSYCQQAENYYQQGDYSSACVAFEQAIEINPKDTKVQCVMEYIHDQLDGEKTG